MVKNFDGRRVRMRGLAFSSSSPALDEATVIDVLTGRTRSPICGAIQLSRTSLTCQDVRCISRGTDFLKQSL